MLSLAVIAGHDGSGVGDRKTCRTPDRSNRDTDKVFARVRECLFEVCIGIAPQGMQWRGAKSGKARVPASMRSSSHRTCAALNVLYPLFPWYKEEDIFFSVFDELFWRKGSLRSGSSCAMAP